jgi:hypothetical protein
MNIEEVLEKYYKKPYKLSMGNIDTCSYSIAASFPQKYINGNAASFSLEAKENIVKRLNESEDIKSMNLDNGFLYYVADNTTIYYIEQDRVMVFLIVRGWGNLTGTGGHNLPKEQAKEIQDLFGNWIVETLSKKIE